MSEAPPEPDASDPRPPIRVLDPATAMRRGDDVPSPTAYLADRLLVSGYPQGTRDPRLSELATELDKLDVRYRVTAKSSRGIERMRGTRGRAREILDEIWVSSIVLVSTTEGPVAPPDAWDVLQRLRAAKAELAGQLSLEHVVRPADGYWGGVGGYWGGVGGYWGGVGGYWGGVGEYGRPGFGGRMPVSVTLPDPALRARDVARRPVVAIPDTAIAEHPWFPMQTTGQRSTASGTVLRMVMSDLELVPAHEASSLLPPAIGDVNSMTGERQALEGHGTFIAGLIRQGCPEATILSVPVLGNDGVAQEGDILDALNALLRRHINGQENDRPADVIDVLSLSMGYYAEDATYSVSPMAGILRRFAEHGVLVVAGVGNDASSAPFVPAALAESPPAKTGAKSRPPVASVGACNPDGHSIALFSNAPGFVSAHRPGVALVSTMPAIDGAGQASSGMPGAGDAPRTTMDPDNYQGGFGVWSGTSFATPVLAAELAAELVRSGDLSDISADAMRRRAIRALRTCVRRSTS